MFAVKKFSPLAQVAKICLRRIIRVTLPAVAKIKHAEIYHAKKKERENFPIYGISIIIATRFFNVSVYFLRDTLLRVKGRSLTASRGPGLLRNLFYLRTSVWRYY